MKLKNLKMRMLKMRVSLFFPDVVVVGSLALVSSQVMACRNMQFPSNILADLCIVFWEDSSFCISLSLI